MHAILLDVVFTGFSPRVDHMRLMRWKHSAAEISLLALSSLFAEEIMDWKVELSTEKDHSDGESVN